MSIGIGRYPIITALMMFLTILIKNTIIMLTINSKKLGTIQPSDKPFITSEIRRKMRQRNRVHYKAKFKKQ